MKVKYFVEGEDDAALIRALQVPPAKIPQGKPVVLNVASAWISKATLFRVVEDTVIFVFDTDVCNQQILQDNINLVSRYKKVILWRQVRNLEEVLVRATDLRDVRELTKSKTKKGFKSDFLQIEKIYLRKKLEEHKIDMSRNDRLVIGSFYMCPLVYKLKDNIGCSLERYKEEELEAVVLRQLKLWFQLVMDLDLEVKQRELKLAVQVSEIQDRINRLQEKQKAVQRKKVALYERYSEGEIDAEIFIPERDRLSAEADGYRSEIENLFKEEQSLRSGRSKRQGEFDHLLVQIRIFSKEEKLTREMTDAFLDYVSVVDSEHMEIHWRWQNLVDEIIRREGK